MSQALKKILSLISLKTLQNVALYSGFHVSAQIPHAMEILIEFILKEYFKLEILVLV